MKVTGRTRDAQSGLKRMWVSFAIPGAWIEDLSGIPTGGTEIDGTQTVTFDPGDDDVRVTLTLEYEIKDQNLLTPVVDLLFVRRAMAESLRRTLRKFANERAAEIQFG